MFYAAEQRGKEDFGAVGWYHQVGDVVDPRQYKTVWEYSSMAEVRRWRRAWCANTMQTIHSTTTLMCQCQPPVTEALSHAGLLRTHHTGNVRLREQSESTRESALLSWPSALSGTSCVHAGRSLNSKAPLFNALVSRCSCEPWFIDTAVTNRITAFYDSRVRSIRVSCNSRRWLWLQPALAIPGSNWL